MRKSTAYGFTLVELLIVIAIVGVLAAVVTLVINPLELQKRSRDANRMSDFATLQQAVNAALADSTTASVGILCVGGMAAGETLCSGNSLSGTRAVDGTGWVKVNFSAQTVRIPVLPIDPLATSQYDYASDGTDWEINAVLESAQYSGKMTTDGGNSATKYEVGTKLTLLN